jgi:hypothetical protein
MGGPYLQAVDMFSPYEEIKERVDAARKAAHLLRE